MDYRFKYQIVDEDENVAVQGSTYLIPSSISQYGQNEMGGYIRSHINKK